jgi:hypothetical protein
MITSEEAIRKAESYARQAEGPHHQTMLLVYAQLSTTYATIAVARAKKEGDYKRDNPPMELL